MSPRVLALSIPNRIAELSATLDRVEAFLAEADVDPGACAQVMIMLDEIASNIIKAAWPADEEHRFQVTLTLEPGGRLLMLTTDDGIPFDPTSPEPPDLDAALEDRDVGGLGLFLVSEISDSMEYSRVDGHNRLLVTKQVGAAPC